jgi:SAM-dependent methyltransferase
MQMSNRHRGHTPFNVDALHNAGYLYSTYASLSAIVANRRLTQFTIAWLKKQKRVRTVVDIGCGDGTYTAEVAKACPNLKFYGCELAKEAVRIANRNYPKIKFTVADVLKFNTLPKHGAQAGIVRGVIHHVLDPQKAMNNVVRYAPRILIIEPNGLNPIVKVLEKISPYHRSHGEQSFTAQKMTSWIELANGHVNNVTYVGLIPFFSPDWMVKILKKLEPLAEKSVFAPLLCGQVILDVERNESNTRGS